MNIAYSIVIPTYSSAASLEIICEQIHEVFQVLDKAYEIILVNDGSPNPETWATIRELCSKNRSIIGINLTRNFGQQNATLCGLFHARGDFMITMDDDLQHDPKDIPKLIAQEEHDIVIATFPKKDHGIVKRLFSSIKSGFDRLILPASLDAQLTAFRLIKAYVIDGIRKISTPSPFLPALIFSISTDLKTVEMTHHSRHDGQGGYTFYKSLKAFSNLIINNSSILLRILGYCGLIISSLSFLFLSFILYNKMMHEISVPGWTSLMTAILFFGGMQLLAIGIIGEYLIRIIRGSEKRPAYHIKQMINKDVLVDT